MVEKEGRGGKAGGYIVVLQTGWINSDNGACYKVPRGCRE